MTTIYMAAASLDGFIATRDRSLDWLLRFGEPEPDDFARRFERVGVIAMGSTT